MSRVLARIGAALLPALAFLASAQAEPPKLPVPAVDQSAVALRSYFYVGGHYVGDPGKEILQGQIYVDVLAPLNAGLKFLRDFGEQRLVETLSGQGGGEVREQLKSEQL